MNTLTLIFAGLLMPHPPVADIEGQVLLANGRPGANAVVYLDSRTSTASAKRTVIDQRRRAFSPRVTAITRGTTVEFPNNDTIFHNVFAEYNAKKFDLGIYPRGSTKRVTFDRVGLVALHCSIHSEMSAYIVVVDTPHYAVTDSAGKFRLSGLPSGSQTVNVWHESGERFAATMVVEPGKTWTLKTQKGRS